MLADILDCVHHAFRGRFAKEFKIKRNTSFDIKNCFAILYIERGVPFLVYN